MCLTISSPAALARPARARCDAERPFLSVVMPVHNGSEWIAATMESLAAEPADGLDIIVIDSSPDDRTADIVDSYAGRLPLRLLRRPDLCAWQTKTNLGVELAGADHVCILHQDDLWLRGRIGHARRWIEQAPAAALHLAPTAVIDRSGRTLGRWTCPLPAETALQPDVLMARLLVQNFVSVPAPIFRRDSWLACGGMDDALWYTGDWDMWAKLAGAGPVLYHDEVTTAFRVHGSSLTVTGSRDAGEFRSQMQVVLDRHLGRIPAGSRRRVERAARASIAITVALAAASRGSRTDLLRAARHLLALGPVGLVRYLRDSRLVERVVPRVRARLAGAF